ncbi:Hypothetical predicted protein [Mytilus galloprovincialis]|uniref:C1q domain-containing protein n=1 Tax=Mytilus galloprovincialis TaxID=29158 RepID=A0A8B6GXB6_MYTGA|nr:Hypothetical predicted protein [Mytilus galloprovincialis]
MAVYRRLLHFLLQWTVTKKTYGLDKLFCLSTLLQMLEVDSTLQQVFRAPNAGVYHFDIIIMSHSGEDMQAEIVKNGNGLVRLYSGKGDTWGVGMQALIVQMNAGDDVWVRVFNTPINIRNVRVFGFLFLRYQDSYSNK